jgi:hypothetical protein
MTTSNDWLTRQVEKAAEDARSLPAYLKSGSGLSVSRKTRVGAYGSRQSSSQVEQQKKK